VNLRVQDAVLMGKLQLTTGRRVVVSPRNSVVARMELPKPLQKTLEDAELKLLTQEVRILHNILLLFFSYSEFQLFIFLLAEVCGLDRVRGPCRNFTVKWFFDMEYGGCSRFWWGGCEGNGNRFNSQDECKSTCVEPEGRGLFLLKWKNRSGKRFYV